MLTKQNQSRIRMNMQLFLTSYKTKTLWLFTESTPRPIQSVSRNVLFLFVPSVGNRNRMNWRLLVNECIAKFTKWFLEILDNFLDKFSLEFFCVFFCEPYYCA